MPEFSIILPIYNVENYILECLESIKNQTFTDFEVLCIDDCGTDASIDIVKDFIKTDCRFKLIHHTQNEGLSQARNTGIDNANGKYIVFVDSDDWVEDSLLEKVYKAYKTTSASSVWYNANRYFEDTKRKSIMYDKTFSNNQDTMFYFNPNNLHRFYDYAWNKSYKRSVLKELNLKFPKGLLFEDGPFYIKAFTRISHAYYLNEPLYNYRIRENSITSNEKYSDKKFKHTILIIEDLYKYLKENLLFSQYKNIILELIVSRVSDINNYQNKKLVLTELQGLFKKINFPQDYE